MNEKTKKMLISLAVRAAAAIMVFGLLMGVRGFFPEVFTIVSKIWTKSSDLNNAAELIKNLFKEAVPF